MDSISYQDDGAYEVVPRNELETNSKFSSNSGLDLYLQDIRKYPIFTAEEERELAKKVCDGDEFAKEELINSFLRLVVYIARKYCSDKNELLDLIQEGNLGLIRAVETFDYTKSYRFGTYAIRVIKNAIFDYFKKTKHRYEISLNTHVEFDMELEDLIEDLESNPEEILLKDYERELNDWVFIHMKLLISESNLTKKEEEIFRLCYDFDKKKSNTLSTVANQMGKTRNNIKYIKGKAVRKIRYTAKKKFGINFV